MDPREAFEEADGNGEGESEEAIGAAEETAVVLSRVLAIDVVESV